MITYDQISKKVKEELSDIFITREYIGDKELTLRYNAFNGNFNISYNNKKIIIPHDKLPTAIVIAVNTFNEIFQKLEKEWSESLLNI